MDHPQAAVYPILDILIMIQISFRKISRREKNSKLTLFVLSF